MRALAACLVVAAACGHPAPAGPAPGTPAHLAAYLQTLAGADEATREHAVAGWILDEATWRRTVVDPYRDLWPDYVRAFDAAAPALVARLAEHGTVTARRHFAGDPQLTRSQGRLRWALPAEYPSCVADLAGTPIDTVFVFDGTAPSFAGAAGRAQVPTDEGARWRVLVGLDEVVLARVRALDPACEKLLERAGPTGRCTEVGWMIADAALRTDQQRFVHACRLAAALCDNASP